jgi:hypothetical protein
MGILDRFRKKKKEEKILDPDHVGLPEDLEVFRKPISFDRPIQLLEREQPSRLTPEPSTPEPTHSTHNPKHSTELILQKLDTIDARLRFIEEKLKKL